MNISSLINRAAGLRQQGGQGGRDAVRPDADLVALDVAAAITRGLPNDGALRRALFTEAAIAAALHAERLGVGPYPVAFLARFIRAGGIQAALELPEPLIGAEPAALVRHWMAAAVSADAGLAGEDVFARWLEAVAALMALRRQVGARQPSGEAPRDV